MQEILSMKRLDVSLFLRAVSIFSIVSGHFYWVGIPGGAYYLIFLSGFNFILFFVPKVECLKDNSEPFCLEEFYSKYFRFLWRIVFPTLLYTCFIFIVLGKFYPGSLLLISNFYQPMYGEGLSFWFIEVLIQIYLLFGVVFYTNRYFFWFDSSPYTCFSLFFVFFYLFSLSCRFLWDTSGLLDRLPHLMLYIFLGGALAAVSVSYKEKIYTTLFLSVVLLEFYFFEFSSRIMFLYFGALITLWLPYFFVPKVICVAVFFVASSSLFIYLTHFQTLSLLKKLSIDSYPGVNVAIAFLVGILATKVWKSRYRFFKVVKIKRLGS